MNTSNKQLTLAQRLKAPTPKFFKTLRTIGITLAAGGAAIIASPLALPAAVITIASYLTLAGTVASVVSQAAVDHQANQPVEQSVEEKEEIE